MMLTFSKLTKTEYITLKKDIYDEVAVKMIPEDVLTKVRHHVDPSISSDSLVVYDAHHGWTKRIMEDEETIRITSGFIELYDLRFLLVGSTSAPIPHLPVDGAYCDDGASSW